MSFLPEAYSAIFFGLRSVSGVNQHANFMRIANQRQLAHSEYAQNDVAAGALIEQIVKTQFSLDGTW